MRSVGINHSFQIRDWNQNGVQSYFSLSWFKSEEIIIRLKYKLH